jgi:hypothetical protein
VIAIPRLVVAPEDGGDSALILKDPNDVADVVEWDIVDDQFVRELSSALRVNVACKGLAPDERTLDERAGFGVHLSLRGERELRRSRSR